MIKVPTEGALFGPIARALDVQSTYGDRYAFYDSAGTTQGYAALGHVPTQDDIDNGWRIVDIVREGDKPAMSEEAAFSLHAEKDVITNPTQLKNLYENDLFDPTNLIAAIHDHAFNVVVFRAQFYPPPVLDAVYQAYFPAEIISMNGFAYEIWRPGPEYTLRKQIADVVSNPTIDNVSFDVALDGQTVDLWLDHMMAIYEWQVSPEVMVLDSGCTQRLYARSSQELHVTVCPSEDRSQLLFGM